MDTARRAVRACALCKKNKRRCDKRLPNCSLCSRMHRPCDYSDSDSDRAATAGDLQSRVQELEDVVARFSHPTPSSATAVSLSCAQTRPYASYLRSNFLSSDISEFQTQPDHAPDVQVPIEVFGYLGSQSSIDQMIRGYFGSVDTWMPIISRAKLERSVAKSQDRLRADLALLLLCMRLVQEVPEDGGAEESLLYTTAKQLYFMLEMAGVYTLTKLQANLLIVVYELGHAVLPSAYVSIGNCARQGSILGIHDHHAPQLYPKARNWLDWEERLRVWWLVMILDRHITTGSDCRPLCTEDPTKDTYIPADNALWNGGVGNIGPPTRVLQSSSTSIPVSPFGRLAQASNLLGRVIRHCNNTTLPVGLILEDIVSLSQTTLSLFSLWTEDRDATGSFSVAAATCLSAMMKLSDNHSCDSFAEGKHTGVPEISIVHEVTEHSLKLLRETAQRIAALVQTLNEAWDITEIDSLSPLTLHCVYRAAIALAWMATQQNAEQYITGKNSCLGYLQRAKARWKVAGNYIELFQVAEIEIEKDRL